MSKKPLTYGINCEVDIEEFHKFLIWKIPFAKVLKLYEMLRKDIETATQGGKGNEQSSND